MIMFREDSQILLRKGIILKVSLRPPPQSAYIPYFKPMVSLCVNYLLKIMSKIKPKPVGLCYKNGIYRRSRTSLY